MSQTCNKCGGSGYWNNNRKYQCFKCKGTGTVAVQPATVIWIEIAAISEHLKHARDRGIQQPKLRMMTTDESVKFEFSLAPSIGANPNYVYVKGNGEYLGKIAPDGHFYPTMTVTIPLAADIAAAAMSDISAAVLRYTAKTGSCGCCGRTLRNKLSVELGIGPICREKYGLVFDIPNVLVTDEMRGYDTMAYSLDDTTEQEG